MFSLAQIPLFAAGAWISLRLEQLVDLPFPLLLIVTGVLTGMLGAVIGIPALRLSGLYSALITLMAAGALTLLQRQQVPQRRREGSGASTRASRRAHVLDRPSIATGDIAYFRYFVIVVALLFLFVTWHIKGKPGRAWAAIRQSQVTAVAAGVHTTLSTSSGLRPVGVRHGRRRRIARGVPGGVSVNQFPVKQSIVLLAVVLMGGVYNIWGAVVAASSWRAFPQLLDQKLGIPARS